MKKVHKPIVRIDKKLVGDITLKDQNKIYDAYNKKLTPTKIKKLSNDMLKREKDCKLSLEEIMKEIIKHYRNR